MSNIGIYSCAQRNIAPEVLEYQQKVFNKFGLAIQQDIVECSHGEYLTNVLINTTNDYVIFFDIDCVPLTAAFYNIIVSDMQQNVLSGAIGCANHLNPNEVYVHPCFMGISLQLYKECGSPDLYAYGDCDAGQRLTKKCVELQKPIKYWEVTDGGDGTWALLPRNQKFGHPTVFANMIYHQFEIRTGQQTEQFINKCKNILAHQD